MLARRRRDLGGGEAPPMPEGERRKADVAALAMSTLCMISGNDCMFYPPSTPELVTLLEAMAAEGDPSVELLETLLKHRTLTMQPLAEAALDSAGVPSELRDFMLWMLAPDSADRPTIEQVAASDVFCVFARAVIASANSSSAPTARAPRVPKSSSAPTARAPRVPESSSAPTARAPRVPESSRNSRLLQSRTPLPSRGSAYGGISTLHVASLRGIGKAVLPQASTVEVQSGVAALQALLQQASLREPADLNPEVEGDMHSAFLHVLSSRGELRALVRVANPELRHAAEAADFALRMAAARNGRAGTTRAGAGTATGRTPGGFAAGLGKALTGTAETALVPRRSAHGLPRVFAAMPPRLQPSHPSAVSASAAHCIDPSDAQAASSLPITRIPTHSFLVAAASVDAVVLQPVSTMLSRIVDTTAAVPSSVASVRSPLSALPPQLQPPLVADSAHLRMIACDRRPSSFPHAAISAAMSPLETVAPLPRLVLPATTDSAVPAPARAFDRPPRHRTAPAAPASVGVGPAFAVAPLPPASLALRPRI